MAWTRATGPGHLGRRQPDRPRPRRRSLAETDRSRSVENLIETGRSWRGGDRAGRAGAVWAGQLARGILAAPAPAARARGHAAGLPGDQPAGRSPARRGDPARRRARPSSRGTAARRPVHRRGRLRGGRPAGLRLSPGCRPSPTSSCRPPRPGGLSARGRTLRNESVELEIDEATGGIRGVMAVGEATARLGQQLVIAGLGEAAGKPRRQPDEGGAVRRRLRRPRPGPGDRGRQLWSIRGPERRLAGFTQRYRLWTGRPILEIDITLERPRPRLARARGRGRSLDDLPGLPLGLARLRTRCSAGRCCSLPR